jgi:glutathione S-transferase
VILRGIDVASSVGASLVRGGTKTRVGELGPRPREPLLLYEFESCPYCRKVREALSILDLDTHVYPCPKGGKRFRPEVRKRGGKEQFPFLVDPNTGKEMYESADIVLYLFTTYGRGGAPWPLAWNSLADATCSIATLLRLGRGTFAHASTEPASPLELWSYEGSPFCRIVREALCSLELPYLLHNVAKGSPRRPALVERSGKMMVPYLADPNTGVEMSESADIVVYLNDVYGPESTS